MELFSYILLTSIISKLIWCIIARPLGLWNPLWFRRWLWFPWRWAIKPIHMLMDWYGEVFRLGKRATGGWQGFVSNACMVFRPGQIYAGRLRGFGISLFQPIGIDGPRHFAMVAGAGSGKSVMLTTQIALWRGNALVIDPDGQITRVLPERDGKRVIALNPYAFRRGGESAAWNPYEVFDWVENRWDLDACQPLAEQFGLALIQTRDKNPFWDDISRNFLVALILFVYVTERDADQRNLVTVRRYLVGRSGFDALLADMQRVDAFGGQIAGRAAEIAAYDADMRGKALSSARTQTAWLDNPKTQNTLKRSDFRLADLKTGDLDLRLCAPVGAIQGELGPWFRLILMMALELFEMIPNSDARDGGRDPCLFVIDEMPALGPIEKLESSAPVMRKFNVRLLIVTQDIGWLRKTYPRSWEGFLGNAEAVWYMGVNHQETANYIETGLGRHVFAISQQGMPDHERPLLDNEQIKRFLDPDRRNVIIMRYAKRPMRVKSGPYFTELPVWMVKADPDHTESAGRRLGRWIISGFPGWFALRAAPRSPASTGERGTISADGQKSFAVKIQDAAPTIMTWSVCAAVAGLMGLQIVIGG